MTPRAGVPAEASEVETTSAPIGHPTWVWSRCERGHRRGNACSEPTDREPRIAMTERAVQIRAGPSAGMLHGDLVLPDDARGLVVFAHGSGSSRSSPRNRRVAEALHARGLATLMFD